MASADAQEQLGRKKNEDSRDQKMVRTVLLGFYRRYGNAAHFRDPSTAETTPRRNAKGENGGNGSPARSQTAFRKCDAVSGKLSFTSVCRCHHAWDAVVLRETDGRMRVFTGGVGVLVLPDDGSCSVAPGPSVSRGLAGHCVWRCGHRCLLGPRGLPCPL